MNYKIIAVDFDGTLCENKWPEIGEANLELIRYLIFRREECGDKIILWTCREGELLGEALAFCTANSLWFDAINSNLPSSIEKFGGDSRKIHADVYVDDKNESYNYSLPYHGTYDIIKAIVERGYTEEQLKSLLKNINSEYSADRCRKWDEEERQRKLPKANKEGINYKSGRHPWECNSEFKEGSDEQK